MMNDDIYIYIGLVGPVKPELGVIPSAQENHSGAEHLNFPSGELNVIFYSPPPPHVSMLFYLSIGSEEALLYFSSCFWFTPETEKQDGNKFIILN